MVAQLHNHSHFSLRDGISRIPGMFARVREMGQSAIALTDHGTLAGAVEFYREGVASGVKPILGVEAYMAADALGRHNPNEDDVSSNNHLTILAMNNDGYRDLIRLVTIANTDGFYHKPRIDFETLALYSKNLFVLSGCMAGKLPQLVASDPRSLAEAKRYAMQFKELFGDRYAIELHDGGLLPQKALKSGLTAVARALRIPVVCSSDSHYLRREDKRAFQLMRAINWNKNFDPDQQVIQLQGRNTVDDWQQWFLSGEGARYFARDRRETKDSDEDQSDIHLLSTEEMIELFGQEPTEYTQAIADRCNVSLDFSRVLLPSFAVPEGYTPHSFLCKQVFDGLTERLGTVNDEYMNRAKYELSIIEKTDYSLYFLIVQDYVQYARNRKVMAIPRGSVAGSLCVYALGICDIDPVKYGIIFERFLNAERKGMPDIDLDFADDCREDIIRYIRQKYGNDHVAHIGTYQTLGARASIKDAARVMQMDFVASNKLTSMFPDKPDVTLEQIIADNQDLRESIESNPIFLKIYQHAKEIEGLNRSFGTHAAGILISGAPLDEVVPVSRPSRQSAGESGLLVTQFDNNNSTANIETLGLSKFDFLGLSNLSIIRDACEIIRKRHGIDMYGRSGELLYSSLPVEYSVPSAQKAYQMLGAGHTTGLFQTESDGMRSVLKMVKPTRLSDLPAIIALFRPGPLENIPRFAEKKARPETIEYLHEDLIPILSETYGVITYQDQVLLIARQIAGFSWGEVDALRKGMGKKNEKVIAEQKQKFIEGALKRGYRSAMVDQLWKDIAPFAGYGFNKAHAYCYGYVAFITAFLKANYPIEYMTSAMMHDFKSKEKIQEYVAECKRMNIPVWAPSINQSEQSFSIGSSTHAFSGARVEGIRFGLTTIKGVSVDTANGIVNGRLMKGSAYSGLRDFIDRSGIRNSKTMQSMIESGCFDEFGPRESVTEYSETLFKSIRKTSSSSQISLLDFFDIPVEEKPIDQTVSVQNMWTAVDRANREREAIGVSLTTGPEEALRAQLKTFSATFASDIEKNIEQEVIIGGKISALRHHIDKKGQTMAFITLSTIGGDIDVVVFAGTFRTFSGFGWLHVGSNIFVYGWVNDQGSRISVMVKDLCPMGDNFIEPPVNSEPVDYENALTWSITSMTPSKRMATLWNVFYNSDPITNTHVPVWVESTGARHLMYVPGIDKNRLYRLVS